MEESHQSIARLQQKFKMETKIGTPFTKTSTLVMLCGSGELGKEVVIELQRLGAEVVAVASYEHAPAHQVADNSAVIDIGGGSVEVCINKDSKMYYESFQLGAVRLLNMNENKYKRSLSKFGDWLNKFKPIPITFGLGGNLRALMQSNNVTGAIKVSELESYINIYKKFDDKTLMEKFSIPKDRIDIVPLAAKIYLFFFIKTWCYFNRK